MKRIMVTGVSPGVGKSTFARRLGEILHISVYHLDTLYWKPGWVETSIGEFSKSQQEIVHRERWIMEGNYSSTMEIRAEQADTIIYLELPLLICLFRVFKRWLTYRGRTRPDLGEGCKEKIDWHFIQFIYTTYDSCRKKMAERFRKFQAADAKKEIILLKSKQEIHSFLENLELREEGNPTSR